ncbi:MAG: hypothetical protein MI717_04630 [Spirochaetales bacterium]|nr:hypothetical protein [Spirochaetales bacterium]
MPKKSIFIALSLLMAVFATLGAQDAPPEDGAEALRFKTNNRSLGDQSFAISAGMTAPLFTVLLHDSTISGFSAGVHPTRLTVGGFGALSYNFYLNTNLKVGLEIGGSFQWDINRNILYMIPIVAQGSWEFHPGNRISIPVHLGLGINMSSWKENFMVDPIIRPGVGFSFDWSVEWSFGLDVRYWFIPQLNVSSKDQKSLGNFMDATLRAEYHF